MIRKQITIDLPVVVNGVTETVDLTMSPAGSAAWLQFVGDFDATYVIESSLDGTTWYALNGSLESDLTPSATPPTSVGAPGMFAFFQLLPTRIRCTAYTSGSGHVAASFADDRLYG